MLTSVQGNVNSLHTGAHVHNGIHGVLSAMEIVVQ